MGKNNGNDDSWLTSEDLSQLKALGISESKVREQIALYQNPPARLTIDRPCTLGDGIERIPSEQITRCLREQEKAADQGRFLKFVPASGAASRMFQTLLQGYYDLPALGLKDLGQRAEKGDQPAGEAHRFFESLDRFAFYEDLGKRLAQGGYALEDLRRQGKWQLILETLLFQPGLNYSQLPKGLLKFHLYPQRSRTAFEEHLVEAAETIKDDRGICRLHLTVAPGFEDAFIRLFEEVRHFYGGHGGCRFEVSWSSQNPATDTPAVDLKLRPFREKDGRLHFRPGGHGALLANLNDLNGDLVYLKNIDNVLPDRLKGPTILWKKILGGYLVQVQQEVHTYLERLTAEGNHPDLLKEVREFYFERLKLPGPVPFNQWDLKEQEGFLIRKLNRPIRVCGMVKNEGEPGGGPFWVVDKEGFLTPQIVEMAQVDPHSPEQQALWAAATHFNPVDLVCALRDFQGRPFELQRHVDPEAVFITRKSQEGRALKALELPGLWNGGMSDWMTFFIEVPGSTFSPVKTILDLLKPDHQGDPL